MHYFTIFNLFCQVQKRWQLLSKQNPDTLKKSLLVHNKSIRIELLLVLWLRISVELAVLGGVLAVPCTRNPL
jgi:hypothetical protein